MAEPTITAIKAAFLRVEVRQLETPLEPSTHWRAHGLNPGPESREGRPLLSDKAVQDLVAKVNDKIKQHNRLVFSTQSQRHVAEQIESLLWARTSAAAEHAELDTLAIRKDVDLGDSAVISALPHDYAALHIHPDHDTARNEEGGDGREGQKDAEEQYARLRGELVTLSRQRDALKARLARYQHLQEMTEPLRDPQENVQPNLVTKHGKLAKELDRTRVILLRIAAQLRGEEQPKRRTKRRRREVVPRPPPQTDQEKLGQVLGWTRT
ncbi:hypothetical protein Z517_08603 [Fonsecaea pedrosoi CBS 271.37]|uniref:Kinetochore protein fta4 n=1 Tax=Fonsecaea pedrosoi CBS 271.37 TaxID=1442368 RepID=A0A0D2H271_9EURO|nr:uncharacterized protein Z517_08603 [Fonsecaea pedrosoi CBS 271.37]KIW78764.1 hypothetical protein Z517_08603 [Fonsecaea pedrosoi CBS 271.37]